MEHIIYNVVANYFDTSKETQTQHETPNYNKDTFNDFIDLGQQQLKNILPILRKKNEENTMDTSINNN